MNHRKQLDLALRSGAATLALGLMFGSTAASAQSVPAETGIPATTNPSAPTGTAATAPAQAGEIVVTGSRIARPDLQQASPVAVVTPQTIALRGSPNIETVLQDLPQVVASANGFTNNPGGGAATVNLRGLGDQRTLVLVNGRRYMSYDVNQVVDLNTIPEALIERIDVVTGGKSSVYGSDAIGGVVNFIMKQNFQGFEAHSQYNLSSRGDGAIWHSDATIGGNFDDDKGNVALTVDYLQRKPVFAGARSFAQNSLSQGFNDDGTPYLYNGGSGSVPQGRLNITGSGAALGTGSNNNTFDVNGVPHAYSSANDAYNYSPVNYLQVPQKRFLFSAMAHYDVSDVFKPYLEAQFANNKVKNQLAATPISNGTPYGDGTIGNLTVQTNSPFLAAAARAGYSTLDTDGDGYISVPSWSYRTVSGVGPRIANYDRTAYRFVVGAKGDLTHGFSYDAYYMYAHTQDSLHQDGNVSISNFLNAVDTAFENPTTGAISAFPIAGLAGGGTLVCASADARAAGCAPANIFGAGNLSSAAAKYIAIGATNLESYTTQVASAAITNSDLFDLGAGGVGLAFGAEWRKEAGSVTPDTYLATGNVAGFNPGQATSGSYSVTELFSEINVPLLRDTFIKKLELNGSARYSMYSNSVNNVWTYAGGALAQIIDDFGLRGQYSRAIRGPSVNELYLGQTVGFNGQSDPCGDSGLSATVATRCGSAAYNGVNPALVGNSSVNNPDDVNPVTFLGGNPNLKAEKARTWTAGAIFTPTFLKGFSLTVDYWDINIKGAIGTYGQANIFNACYTQGIQAFCSLFTRNSLGQVDSITDINRNTGSLKTAGVDVSAGYSLPFSMFQRQNKLSFAFAGTYTRKFDYTPVAGVPIVNHCAGSFGTSCGNPQPKWKQNVRLTADFGNFSISGAWRYIGHVHDDDPETVYSVERIKAQNYFDLATTTTLADKVTLTAGVTNMLDKKPPLVPAEQNGGNGIETNTFPEVYDVIGRAFFVSAGVKF